MGSATGKLDNTVTMKASEFKAKCLRLTDEVADIGTFRYQPLGK